MIVAAILLATVIRPFCERADVDVCELNHVIGDDGEAKFTQLILWRWVDRYPTDCDYHVSQFFLLEPHEPSPQVKRVGLRTQVLFRARGGCVYDVRATSFRETTTVNDPEVDDRTEWSTQHRVPYFPW